jgi:hypothetical protein
MDHNLAVALVVEHGIITFIVLLWFFAGHIHRP